MLIINPETEAVQEATFENAEKAMQLLIEHSEQSDFVTYETVSKNSDDGRYDFILSSSKHEEKIEVSMPGCDPEITSESRPFHSPRLYVNGSSWLWGYAFPEMFCAVQGLL